MLAQHLALIVILRAYQFSATRTRLDSKQIMDSGEIVDEQVVDDDDYCGCMFQLFVNYSIVARSDARKSHVSGNHAASGMVPNPRRPTARYNIKKEDCAGGKCGLKECQHQLLLGLNSGLNFFIDGNDLELQMFEARPFDASNTPGLNPVTAKLIAMRPCETYTRSMMTCRRCATQANSNFTATVKCPYYQMKNSWRNWSPPGYLAPEVKCDKNICNSEMKLTGEQELLSDCAMD